MVGPDAKASGVLSGTSETRIETCWAGNAACANLPPLIAERCLRIGVDFGDGRAGLHEHAIGCDQIL